MNSRKLALLLTLYCLVVSTYAGTKITCVGASITYGAFIDDRQHSSFPGQLQQLPGNQYGVLIVRRVIPGLQKAAYEKQVEVPDMHQILINHPELMPDKIHPDKAGAAIIAKRLYESLIQPKWAAQNPGKVSAVYIDNPLLDMKSWPCGLGKRSAGMLELEAFNKNL